ncbi:aldo/keto reductase [Allonocardiopsis opalescens]|uniref:Aryl-alcohol dehydrogenase-like predicted oxidoreductase n=1 Tax=Allonocardiopsis opalescens TaxID=1144618 RepID=A0A2T0Q524_9ACTN|nr:aldo/keto reductase [Allonocardiopsis opalescens]PRX98873.1 aryl-alcohol dehydrogenase-like predicted oxidoreductase [Allonocardiopsis opalescens]
MRYKLLGRTGIRVSELCLGTMTFGEAWGWGAAKEESGRILEAFAEAGGNFIDTANRYTDGESENIVGELIAGDRDHWVLSTKYALNTRPDDPNAGGSHRKNLARSLDASLKRLGTDHIDLYWVHIWDAFTPVEEVMRALDDAVRAGKVLAVGISDTPAWLVSQANTIADLRGWTPFAGLQVPYNVVERTVERELLPVARGLDLTVTAWGPLAGGLLTGRYGTDRPRPDSGRIAGQSSYSDLFLNERNLRIADALNAVAEARGVSTAQAAIAWVRAQQHRASIVPIVGARTAEQMAANLGVLDVHLTEEELAALDEVSRIEAGFPYDFPGRRLAYGDTFDLIDAPGLKIDA